MSNTIVSQSVIVSVPSAQTLSSELLQGFADRAVTDIQALTRQSNEHTNELGDISTQVVTEVDHLRTSIRTLEANQSNLLKAAKDYVYVVDFRSKRDMSYAAGTPETNKLVLDPKYGNVYLPVVGYTPVFYAEDNSGNVQEISNLQFGVTPNSEPIIPGYSQIVETTTPNRAVNGQNTDSWVRTISYPMEAPVTEVVTTYEVYLGDTAQTKAFNMFRMNLFPAERVDVLGVWYKPTASSNWILLEEFPQSLKSGDVSPSPDPINNADHTQYIGQIRSIYGAKIQIRQRNWIELNNKKTFIYGLQELDFKLMEFSTQNSTYNTSELDKNNHLVIEVSAPAGQMFKNLIGLDSTPLVNLEGNIANNNHLLVYISKTPSIATPSDILWKSNSNPLPSSEMLALNLNTYYLIVMMKYVETISSAQSPFNAKTSPVLSEILLTHRLQVSSDSGAPVVDTTDWTTRNWALHKAFVSHMDVYKALVDASGANVFILGDDFWSGYTHRNVLDGVTIKPILMSLVTATSAPGSVGTLTYKTLGTVSGSSPVVPFIPRRLRVQSVHNKVGTSQVRFRFNYNTSGGPATEIVVVASDNSILWYDLTDGMTDFTLTVELTNSAIGEQPTLGQFILILKD